MSTTIYSADEINKAIESKKELNKYAEDRIKQYSFPLIIPLDPKEKKILERNLLSLSIGMEPLGALYILNKEYKLAKQSFSSALKFRKLYMELSSSGKYNWYADILFLFKNAILSLNSEELSSLSKFSYWIQPLDERGGQSTLVAKALGYLALGDDIKAREFVELTDAQKTGWAGGGLNTINAILNNGLEALKSGIKQLVQAHIGENRPYLSNIHNAVALFPTAYLILAAKRGMNLSDLDPKYVPMDYIALACM